MLRLHSSGLSRRAAIQSTTQRLRNMTMNNRIEEFLQQAKQFLPSDSLGQDIEKNLRALASSTFSKMDLVSKEEFEAQTAVLMRTREKLEQLEQQLEQLNQQINKP